MKPIKFPYQIAIALAVMALGPLLIGQISRYVGGDPDELHRARTKLCRDLAAEGAVRLPADEVLEFQHACQQSLQAGVGLNSLRVIMHDGTVVYESADHSKFWKLKPSDHSTAEQVRIPLMQGRFVNAEMEMAFEPSKRGLWEYLAQGALFLLVCLGLNYQYLYSKIKNRFAAPKPNKVLPQRVRNTLDTLVGGVVILDNEGSILLANDSFAKYVGQSTNELGGKQLQSFAWEKDEADEWPWTFALREQSQQAGTKLHLNDDDKSPRTFMVNATPVFDSKEGFSGALVSFEDITMIEDQRRHLLTLLSDLEASKEQIHRQNQVLHELASRDGLTGSLNRRALFEKLEDSWERVRHGEGEPGLVVLLLDVDHFKQLNDRHGHLVGDKALKDVSNTILRIVDDLGWFARYGGEEFCVVSDRIGIDGARKMAEEIRRTLELEHLDPYQITVSIGVASSNFGATSYLQMLEQADLALYAAKQSGRNCVRVWVPGLEDDALTKRPLRQSDRIRAAEEVENRVSYHAVISLNSAVSCRFPEVVLHSHRVSEVAVAMARNWLPAGSLYMLESAALLHDIGVMSLPDKERFTPAINQTMADCFGVEANKIASAGAQILRAAFQCQEIIDVLDHQATPYWKPSGNATAIDADGGAVVSGDERIPVASRIIAIANAYDHLLYPKGSIGSPKSKSTGSVLVEMEASRHQAAVDTLLKNENGFYDPVWLERLAALGAGVVDGQHSEIEVSEASALLFGYQVDRVIHCLETRKYDELRMRLKQLEISVGKFDVPKITEMLQILRSDIHEMTSGDWESLLPTLRDLVEICLTIQRAYLKNHAGSLVVNETRP